MAYYPNNTVPIPTTGPHTNRSQELPVRAQRTNQVQYVEERLRNGLSPLAVAGVAALLTQLDTMQTLPGVSVSLVTEVAGYRRTLTCQNNAWDGHDLTHQFLDERSTTMLGPSQGTRFEQEASLCMVPASVATMPPPQMVALPPPAPKPVPMTPTYSGSPAFGTSYRAPHMVLQTTTSAPVSDREPSGSRLPPIPNPELTGRSTSEQAVIVALQAVANYPNSSDFVRAVEQRIPGLATYLQAAVQPSGCDPPAPLVETASMDVEIAAGPSNSASAATGTREEAGRKRWKEPLGWPRAKPVGRAPETFNRQIQHLESAQIPGWIEGAAQIRQRNLQSRVIPFPRKSAWKPTGKMTMSGDMSIVQHDEINSVLGSTERARWEEYCLELEIAGFPKWKRACELWSQPGWISRRVALAVEGRAEIARQQAFAPTMLAPTMAMSLDRPISQLITINLPTHHLEPEPVGPSSSRTSTQSLQQQSGEHAAELTPNAALEQPIAELSLPEDLSDSETVATEVSPRRRASFSTDNPEQNPDDATKERTRRSSAQ